MQGSAFLHYEAANWADEAIDRAHAGAIVINRNESLNQRDAMHSATRRGRVVLRASCSEKVGCPTKCDSASSLDLEQVAILRIRGQHSFFSAESLLMEEACRPSEWQLLRPQCSIAIRLTYT